MAETTLFFSAHTLTETSVAEAPSHSYSSGPTPSSAGTFTASSKVSRSSGIGLQARIYYSHQIASGAAICGDVIYRLGIIDTDSPLEVTIRQLASTYSTIATSADFPAPSYTHAWTLNSSSLTFTASSKVSRAGAGLNSAILGSRAAKGGAGISGGMEYRLGDIAKAAAITTTQTLHSTAAILNTTTKTLSSTAAITGQSYQQILSVATIFGASAKTLSSTAAIKNTTTKTITSTAAVKKTTTKTLSSTADILNTTTKTISSRADILNTTTKTLSSAAAVSIISTQTLSSTASIVSFSAKILNSTAAILNTTTQTLSSTAQIIVPTSTQTILSTAAIMTRSYAMIQSKAAIQNTTLRTLSSTAELVPVGTVTTPRTITSTAAISNTTLKTIHSVATLKGTSTRTISSTAKIQSPDTTPPTQPTALTISGDPPVLNWIASTDDVGIASYLIQRCTGGGCGSFLTVATVGGSTTTFTDFGLPSSGTYCYQIVAVDTVGNQSVPSTVVCTTLSTATVQVQITSTAAIQSATPSVGLLLAQNVFQVLEHPVPVMQITQAVLQTLIRAKEPSMELVVSQVNVRVAIPYVGTKNIATNHTSRHGWR